MINLERHLVLKLIGIEKNPLAIKPDNNNKNPSQRTSNDFRRIPLPHEKFPIYAALGALSAGKMLLGRISSGGTSRTTPNMESYSSSRRACFLRNAFSNSISSKLFAFSAAWTCAKLE